MITGFADWALRRHKLSEGAVTSSAQYPYGGVLLVNDRDFTVDALPKTRRFIKQVQVFI